MRDPCSHSEFDHTGLVPEATSTSLQCCAFVSQRGPGVRISTLCCRFADGTRSPDFNVVLSLFRCDQESRLQRGPFVVQMGPGVQTSTWSFRFSVGTRSPDFNVALSFFIWDQESRLQRCAIVLQMGSGVQTWQFSQGNGTHRPVCSNHLTLWYVGPRLV